MKRKAIVAVALLLVVALLVVLLPSLILQAPARRWIMRDLLAQHGVDADIRHISLGWFKPLRVEGVKLGPVDKPTLVRAERIESDRTLWSAITEGVELGRLSIDRPEIHLWMEKDSSNLEFPKLEEALAREDPANGGEKQTAGPNEAPTPTEAALPAERTRLTVDVRDASLFVKTPTMTEEVNVFSGLDLAAELNQDESGRTVLVPPGRILDHGKISPELCEGGLKYIVPILAEATWTKGEFSIDLDACIIDLDNPEESLVSGTLHVHSIEAGIRNDLLAAAGKRVATLLGKDVEAIHLADESKISFHVRDGLVWHDGVEFGLPRVSPDLVVRSAGSVSFDEQIDLTVEIPTPLHLIADGAFAKALMGRSLVLKSTGTLEKPEVAVDSDAFVGELLNGLSDQMENGERPLQDLANGIRGAIGRFQRDKPKELEDGEAAGEVTSPGLLERLRQRREEGAGPLRRLFRGVVEGVADEVGLEPAESEE